MPSSAYSFLVHCQLLPIIPPNYSAGREYRRTSDRTGVRGEEKAVDTISGGTISATASSRGTARYRDWRSAEIQSVEGNFLSFYPLPHAATSELTAKSSFEVLGWISKIFCETDWFLFCMRKKGNPSGSP